MYGHERSGKDERNYNHKLCSGLHRETRKDKERVFQFGWTEQESIETSAKR